MCWSAATEQRFSPVIELVKYLASEKVLLYVSYHNLRSKYDNDNYETHVRT